MTIAPPCVGLINDVAGVIVVMQAVVICDVVMGDYFLSLVTRDGLLRGTLL